MMLLSMIPTTGAMAVAVTNAAPISPPITEERGGDGVVFGIVIDLQSGKTFQGFYYESTDVKLVLHDLFSTPPIPNAGKILPIRAITAAGYSLLISFNLSSVVMGFVAIEGRLYKSNPNRWMGVVIN
jgi:hypothetical protein